MQNGGFLSNPKLIVPNSPFPLPDDKSQAEVNIGLSPISKQEQRIVPNDNNTTVFSDGNYRV